MKKSIKPLSLNIFFLIVLFRPWSGNAQTSFITTNTIVTVNPGAKLYISGDYIDQSSGGGRLKLFGHLVLGGNLDNRGSSPVLNSLSAGGIFEFKSLAVSSNKRIISPLSTVYIPTLTINVNGSFTLPNTETIPYNSSEGYQNYLNVVQGNIQLNNSTLELREGGFVQGDSDFNRIEGEGSIHTFPYDIPLGSVTPNFYGTGLGFNATVNSFVNMEVTRVVNPISTLSAADGITARRFYKLEFGKNGSATSGIMSRIDVRYYDSEIPTGLSEPNLALYVSTNSGTTWVKQASSTNSATNIVEATDVYLEKDTEHLLALGPLECSEGSRPTAKPTMSLGNVTIEPRNTTQSVMKACFGQELILNSSAFYHEWQVGSLPIQIGGTVTFDVKTLNGDGTFQNDGAVFTLYERTQSGCERKIEYTLDVLPLPEAHFAHTPVNNRSCFGEPVTFFDNGSTGIEPGLTIQGYMWDFDDKGATTTSPNPTHTFSESKQFNVELQVTNNYGCVSVNTSDFNVFVHPLPNPDFNINDIGDPLSAFCEDEVFQLENTTTYTNILGDITSPHDLTIDFDWNFGNGNSVDVDPTHKYPFPEQGEKTIYLTATVKNTLCKATISKGMTVHGLPQPAFHFESPVGTIVDGVEGVCEGVDIKFGNSSTISDGATMTYNWAYGDGSTSTEEEPTHEYLYTSNPPYLATLKATSEHGCYNSAMLPMRVHPAPAGDFQMEFDELVITDICTDVGVDFINNSEIADGTPLSYSWNFNDGSATSNDETLSHAFSDPRVHTISLTRTTNKLCTNTVERYLTVHAFPDVDFVFNDVCDGLPAAFYDASNVQTDAISSYLWDFGDSETSNLQNLEHQYDTYGSYTVKLTAANTSDTHSCVASVEKTVEVFQKPSFNIGPLCLSCSGSFTIDPTADASAYIPAGTSFTWYNALGKQLSTDSAVEVYESGLYKAVLTTDDPQNCEASFSIPVYIVDPGDLGANRTVCESTVLDATPFSMPPTGVVQYEWLKDGSPIAETGSSLLVTESGNYSVTVTYSPDSGTMTPFCSYSDDVTITIDEVPMLDLGGDVLVCQGENATLSSNISGDSYVWVKIASGLEVGYDATLEVTEAGQYRLTVEAGTCSVSDVVSVGLLPAPKAGFLASALLVCEGEEVSFSDISFSMTAGDPVVARQWDFGNGETANSSNPSTTYASSGSYTVTLEVETQNGCSDTFTRAIMVDAPPVVSFDAENACQGTSVTFTNTSSITASPVSYFWRFGDGTTSTEEHPTHTYEDAGLFDVTLKITSGMCTEELLKQIEIYQAPDLDLAATSVTCGNQLVLDAGSPGATYRWYDVVSGGTLGVDQTYTVMSNMAIGVEVTTPNGCLLNDETSVTLNSPVQIDLGADREVCGTITLGAGAFPNGTYAWSTGETSRKISVTTSGLYSMSFVDQNGCTDSDEVFITVSPLPSVDLGENITACSGSIVSLNAKNPGALFLWSTGETSQSIAIAETGTYTVRVSVGNCWVEDDILVTFLESPEVNITFTGQCEGDAISFEPVLSNDTGTLNYLWSFGDGTQSANPAPNKIFSVANTYEVTLVATNAAGCKTEVSKLVSVQSSPKPNFVFKNVCEEEELAFTNTTAYAGNLSEVSYLWDFGDGNTSEAIEPNHGYQTKGRYFVTLTASTDASCERTQTKEMVVNQGPSLNLPASIETCESTYLLDAGNPGNTYKWQNNSSNRTYLATQSGTYTVRVTNTNGCAVSGAVEVTLLESELPALGEDREACGEEVLDPGISAASYLWSTGQTSPKITASETGTYWVETISNDLCIHRDTVNLIVYPRPVISLGDDVVLCQGEPLTLDATSSIAKSYVWSNGATEPLLAVSSSGTYGVTLSSPKGCTFFEEIKVTVNELPALAFDDEYEACESKLLEVTNIRSEFLWSTGNTGKSIKITESDTYWLKITDRNGCVNTDTTTVTIRPKPTVDLGPDVVLCYGETAEVDAGVQAGYRWNDLSDTRFKAVGVTGTYSVTVTNEFGCENSDKINVTVKPTLGLNLAAEALICSPEEFFLDAGVADVAYFWTSNTGYTSTDKIIYPTEPGTYYLQVTAADGCVETDMVEVKETTQKITASFLIPSEVAAEEEVHFVQLTEPAPLSFQWSFGDGYTSVRRNPPYVYYEPGDYTVSLTVSNGVCSDTEEKQLRVLELRPAEQAPDKVRLLELYRSKLYPNPAEEVVKIDLELSEEAPVMVQIFSLSGLKVAAYEFVGIEELIEFNMRGMVPGTYIMAIQAGRITKTIRFVKTY